MKPAEANGIWVLVQMRSGAVEESTFGLIAEGRRLLAGGGNITAVVLEPEIEPGELAGHGVDRILCVAGFQAGFDHGEFFAHVLSDLAQRENPSFILMAHSQQSMDLAPRLAASLKASLVTRAVDLQVDEPERVTAVRPVSNGYLFEEVEFQGRPPFIVSFLPSALSAASSSGYAGREVSVESIDGRLGDPRIRVSKVTRPDAQELDLEEADIVVSGGRGVGKADGFETVHELARVLGGSVGGTRPVVDSQALPFERQIGQTGKTVTPRLLFACGISGANEYTAGMEKSQLVVAINTDPSARIFRFADLGVVGDVHEVLPLLIKRIKDIKETR